MINLCLRQVLFGFKAEDDLILVVLSSLVLLLVHSPSVTTLLSEFHDALLLSRDIYSVTRSLQHSSCAFTTKKFSYLLVKSGTLLLKARSDLKGYVPGQVIKLATEIHNKSGKDTGYVLASLIQVAGDSLFCPSTKEIQ